MEDHLFDIALVLGNAGVPTQAAQAAAFNPSTGVYLDGHQFRVALAADRNMVLRVLATHRFHKLSGTQLGELIDRLSEMRVGVLDKDDRMWDSALRGTLSLLAPEAPRV